MDRVSIFFDGVEAVMWIFAVLIVIALITVERRGH